MNYKAIGLETKHIYIIGTHPECVRYVNEKLSHTNRPDARKNVLITHDEPIKIMPEHATIETEEEKIERQRKEWQLATIQENAKISTYRKTKTDKLIDWNKEKEDWLLDNTHREEYERCDLFEQKFGEFLSKSAMTNRLHKIRKERNISGVRDTVWTPEEDAYLIASHSIMTALEIADKLGRTKAAVNSRITGLFATGQLQRKKNWAKSRVKG